MKRFLQIAGIRLLLASAPLVWLLLMLAGATAGACAVWLGAWAFNSPLTFREAFMPNAALWLVMGALGAEGSRSHGPIEK